MILSTYRKIYQITSSVAIAHEHNASTVSRNPCGNVKQRSNSFLPFNSIRIHRSMQIIQLNRTFILFHHVQMQYACIRIRIRPLRGTKNKIKNNYLFYFFQNANAVNYWKPYTILNTKIILQHRWAAQYTDTFRSAMPCMQNFRINAVKFWVQSLKSSLEFETNCASRSRF